MAGGGRFAHPVRAGLRRAELDHDQQSYGEGRLRSPPLLEGGINQLTTEEKQAKTLDFEAVRRALRCARRVPGSCDREDRDDLIDFKQNAHKWGMCTDERAPWLVAEEEAEEEEEG